MSSRFLRSLSLGAALALGFLGTPVRGETINCTALTLPAVITVPGIYCLNADWALNISGFSDPRAAIEVRTSNVVIDLNGHKIGNLSAGPGNVASGVWGYRRQNITVRNGTIRGFAFAVLLNNDGTPYDSAHSQGHLVEDVRADQSTYAGIFVDALGSLVRRNQVVATGGSTHPDYAPNAYGIYVSGPGNRVIDNDVVTVTKQTGGVARGIAFDASMVVLTQTRDGFAVGNRITDVDRGIEYIPGSTGKYRGNRTSSVVGAPYSGPGAEDAGDNH